MIVKYLEISAKELVKEFAEHWKLTYVAEKFLLKMIALRDAEILAKIAIDGENEEADTLPPEMEEVTKS